VNDNNNVIKVDNVSYKIPNGTFTNGYDLASNVQIALESSNVKSVVYSNLTSNLVFSSLDVAKPFTLQFFNGGTVGTMASILGFNGSNVSGTTVSSGPIDLTGPSSIFLRLTVGADDLDKDVFVNGGTFTFGASGGLSQKLMQIPPHYIGRIILGTIGETHIYNVVDAPITYTVPSLNMTDIRIRMYWNNGTILVPYDFGNRNHILKFDITCETDRFMKVYDVPSAIELPPPISDESSIPEPARLSNNSTIFIGIAVILILGLLFLIFNGPSPRILVPEA